MTTDKQLEPIRQRLEELEKEVNAIKGSVHLIEMEQKHFRELFNVRLTGIEKGMETAGFKLDSLVTGLTAMSTELDKSPMGRAIISHVKEVSDKQTNHKVIIDNMIVWQNRVDGVLLILKWLGAGGVVSLGINLIRLSLGK